MLLLFTMIVGGVSAQTITGNVKDATGEDVIGATIMETGTKNGTVTDFDGNFTLKLTAGKKEITVSYVGMKTQTVNIAGKTSVNVVLQDDETTLQDVVVVGYGTMKKSDLTGSIASVETEKLNAKGNTSVIANLQGSVPGVNITQSSGRTNGGFNIEIRGKSSHQSATKPVYVIDGVVADDMDFLNPQDIERIDVLKDASSTAIYGSRATAGVVMVTTKSGAGVAKKASKPTVSYDGYLGTSKVARMPDFMNPKEFYDFRFMKYIGFSEGGMATAQSGQPGYAMGGMWQHMLCWKTDPDNDVSGLGGYSRLKYFLENGMTYDWPDLVTRDGQQQNHYLAVSGTIGDNADVSYHMGLGYNSDTGVFVGDEQNKITFKGSVDAKLYKWLTAGFSVNLARQHNDYGDDNGIQYAFRMNPFMNPYEEDGSIADLPGNYIHLGSDNGQQFSDQVSPLIIMFNQTQQRETWRLLGNFYVNIKPLSYLSLKSTFAPNYSYYRNGTFNQEDEHVKGYEPVTDPDADGGNRAIIKGHRALSWTWTNQINFNKTFDTVHTVDVMAMNEVIASNSEDMQITARRVLDGSTWWNVGSTVAPGKTTVSSGYSESSMISYALRANYSYAGKYMATATVRWDGSSKFSEKRRWGSFPSLALAWRLSEENFMKSADWLSNLKLRVSYGVTGNNMGIGNYATQQTVASGRYYPFGGTYYGAYYPSGIVDALLSWEKSYEINLGLDFGFLGGRINGSIDIYQKDSKDLLYDVNLPLEAGLNGSNPKTVSTNVGKVRNKGVEVTLSTVNVQTKDWNWTTSLNFSANKNELREINGTGNDLPANGLFVGQPINNVYQYNWTGIVDDRYMKVPDNDAARNNGFTPGEQVKSYDYYYKVYGWTEGNAIIEDVNGDGQINDDDKRIWRKDPAWVGSFTSDLSWKNWDFSFNIYARQGSKAASNFYSEYMNYDDRGRVKLAADFYIPAGTLIDFDGMNADGTYVNPVYQQQTHYGSVPFPNSGQVNGGIGPSQWLGAANTVTNTSFVKVKYITLGYTFSKNLLNKVGVQKLRLYATVTNPFVFTGYKGFDPEWADASNKNDGPSTITYQIGASLKF